MIIWIDDTVLNRYDDQNTPKSYITLIQLTEIFNIVT